MPLYTYRCPQCNERETHLVRAVDSDLNIQCPVCKVDKEKLFDVSGQTLEFKGDWFKTKGAY